MIRFKDIHIPKPCSVDYDSLSGDDVKRFCGSCEKHVYDFRGKNETYLNQISKNEGKVCGIYYEDQIQKPGLQIQRPFYYAFATKIISIGLFLKTIFFVNDTDASTKYVQAAQYEQQDSIPAIKAKFKNRPKKQNAYTISIFINNILYKRNVSVYDGYLYVPDATSADDSIKILVHEKRPFKNRRISHSIKPKEYLFTFKESDKIVVEIDYNFHYTLIKRRQIKGKRRSVVGDYKDY